MKKCIICKTKFPDPKYNAANAKYCSPKCRVRFYNIKYRKKHADWQRERNWKKAKEPSEDKIQCAICGLWFKRVVRHANIIHKTTKKEYKEYCGLDVKRGILTEKDRKLMRDHTKTNGTIKNLKAGKKNWFKKGQPGVGVYKRSDQTMQRLREQGKRIGALSKKVK